MVVLKVWILILRYVRIILLILLLNINEKWRKKHWLTNIYLNICQKSTPM